MKKIIIGIFVFLSISVLAQNGSVIGKVIDAETGEELIGATVVLSGTTTGAAANLFGDYEIKNLEPGTYTLVCKYISYQSDSISGVLVKAGEITSLNIEMSTSAIKMNEVTIRAKANRAGLNYMLNTKQESAILLDGISAKEIARGGDNDVAGALKRVTGVTVEGGKYVYVRGLSDRYSKTTLNRAIVPSLDPRRNAVQMDMFPVSMVDNISIYKTFSPDLPGDFSGGLINITTKDIPEEFKLTFSASLGYNTNATFNPDFQSANKGVSDWFANGSKDRKLPEIVKNKDVNPIQFSSFEMARNDAGLTSEQWNSLNYKEKQDLLLESRKTRNQLLTDQSQSFNKNWNPQKQKAGLNQSYNFSFGNKTHLFGNELGFNFGANYSKKFRFYNDGITGRYSLTGNVDDTHSLTAQTELHDTRGDEAVNWGALFNFSYQIGLNNKITFNYLHNQNGLNSGRNQVGTNPSDDPDMTIRINSSRYLERYMNTYQLSGEHIINSWGGLTVNWVASAIASNLKTPDLRVWTNDFTVQETTSYFDADGNDITDYVNGEDLNPDEIENDFPGFTTTSGIDTLYNISVNLYPSPTRFFRNMNEKNNNVVLHFSLPFNRDKKGQESSIKFGGNYVNKTRETMELRYSLVSQGVQYRGNDQAYFNDSNITVIPGNNFIYLRDDTEKRNSYSGKENDYAAFLMVDWKASKKLRFIAGARLETTNILTQSLDTALGEGILNRIDILPALNATYALTQKMNLRISATRTLARPTFRELAPYASYDFDDNYVYIGNINLQSTFINNLDLRWEMFPKSGEIISISFFYKYFTDPIQKVVNPEAANVELTWDNVEKGQVYGLELEFRKSLSFVSDRLKDFGIGANLTLAKSFNSIDPDELAQIRAQDPGHSDIRDMFGQAPYVVNGYLTYMNRKSGIEANLTYNVIGPRMVLVVQGGTPNVYEQPFNLLSFNISKTLGQHFSLRFSADNILNQLKRQTYSYKGELYDFQSNTIGSVFSLSVKFTI